MDLIETRTGGTTMTKEDKQILDAVKIVLAEQDDSSEEADNNVTPAVIRESDSETDPQIEQEEEVSEDGANTSDEENVQEETFLEAGEIAELVDSTKLAQLTKTRIKAGQYASLTDLREVVEAAVAETKAISGSGAPFAASAQTDESEDDGKYVQFSDKEYNARMNEIDREVGIPINQLSDSEKEA